MQYLDKLPLKNFTFDANITIRMKCVQSTAVITLNSVDLNITENSVQVVETESGNSISVKQIETKKELEMILFHLGDSLKEGMEYNISMEYVGPISEKLAGFYRSRYKENGKTKWLGVTQFQPVAARRAFPGFDEPQLKAVFAITIQHPEDMYAISNAMEIESIRIGAGWNETRFSDSPIMSSYLVAFAVCDFRYRQSTTSNGILFRIWARPSLIKQTDYAAEIGPEILEYFENYYNISFPLQKQDMIALPDFQAGAMENWGLITYREKYLLYDKTVYSLYDKQYVAVVVAHELAHQWFGNLVTMKWWDDIWLNEGFASLMEYFGTNSTDPEYEMFTQFIRNDVQRAMAKDQLASSHPLSIYVGKAADVYEIFDVISYQKGASIIRMVQETMGANHFEKGLNKYLVKYSYNNADHKDLWNSLSEVAATTDVKDWKNQTINVSEFADPWTIQMGYPLVSVARNYTANSVILTQKRFKLDPNAQENEKYRNPRYGYKWYIPLWYITGSDSEEQRNWLPMNQSKTIKSVVTDSENDWFLMNSGVKAYFRTQYDAKNWKLLTQQLNDDHKAVPVTSRSQLIDDAFSLARANLLDYEIALNLTTYLKSEENYIPWATAVTHLSFIGGQLLSTENYGVYQKYMQKLIKPVYENYGWEYDVPENDVLKQLLQTRAVSSTCHYGNQDCIDTARDKFDAMVANCNSDDQKLSGSCNKAISSNLRSTVYCTSIVKGNATYWDFLWEKYQLEDISVEKSRLGIIHELRDTCSQAVGPKELNLSSDLKLAQPEQTRHELVFLPRNHTYISRILTESLKGEKIRHQDASSMFFNVARNPVGRELIWSYFVRNWELISKTFGDGYSTINYIVRASTESMNSDYHVSQLEYFLKTNPKAKKYGSFKEQLERAKANTAWMKQHFESLSNWFRQENE